MKADDLKTAKAAEKQHRSTSKARQKMCQRQRRHPAAGTRRA